MEWLNYHHLLYFWTAAREGSVTGAADQLRLAQSTVSAQIRLLEESLGERLFRRQGRRVVLTDVGRVVYRYADEIFTIGRELLDTVKDRPTGRPVRLNVGVADQLPKAIAYRLLAPALRGDPPVRLVCQEGKVERLLADLALHHLDVVLADAPVGPGVDVRAFSHLLGECGITIFGVPKLATALKRKFPASLGGAPMLLPTLGTVLRRSLDQWFDAHDLHPHVVSEFEDSALLKAFGESGLGVFPAPSAIESQVCRQYGVRVVGRLDAVRERFYAISVERRIKHPAVVAISDAARASFHD